MEADDHAAQPIQSSPLRVGDLKPSWEPPQKNAEKGGQVRITGVMVTSKSTRQGPEFRWILERQED